MVLFLKFLILFLSARTKAAESLSPKASIVRHIAISNPGEKKMIYVQFDDLPI